jgi:hypothetical protein
MSRIVKPRAGPVNGEVVDLYALVGTTTAVAAWRLLIYISSALWTRRSHPGALLPGQKW